LALASIRVLPAEAAPAAPGAPPATDTPPALPEAAP
ncbi:N-acetylmuramoyl-L-alanine amidase, partial [bacterium]